ncbi:MAG: hypothetical protein J4G05_06725 [Chlorobi bacterium]|nr:hypothetical protein [Chlorobiota bacterium]
MKKIYAQKLDLYYVATIAYLVTLIAYAGVTGTLIGERLELIWRDPIVYLLALCAVVALIALLAAAVLNKKVTIRESDLVFATRFKEKTIRADEIAWISFRRGSRGKLRDGVAQRAATIKLKSYRRRLWLRPSMFDESEKLMRDLKEWAERNRIPVRSRRGIRRQNKENDE